MDCFTTDIVERLKFSSIEKYFDNIIYESNYQNAKFDDLTFDGDESLITRQQIYLIHDNIIFRLNNGSSVDA